MLAKRVVASLIFAPALFGLVYVGGTALELACLCICLLMLWEYQRMTLGEGAKHAKMWAHVLSTAVAAAMLGWVPAPFAAVLLPAVTLVSLLAALLQPHPLESSIQRAALALLGAAYAGGLLPFLARLRGLEQGLGLSLMALFCAWGADTGAYFAGRFLGRHKLYPSVSPGKTVEGAVGGLASAVGVALLIRWLFSVDLGMPHTVALGTIAAVLGMAGDLCESMLKRSAGVKDSSTLIPGHGGVLDRFDAVLFVAPSFFIYLLAIGHGQSAP